MSERVASKSEMLAVLVARELRNGDVAFTGLTTGGKAAVYATGIPLAAMGLAQQMHAPDLTILLAGWIHNPDFTKLKRLPAMEFLPELLDLQCDAQMYEYPGQWSVKRGDITVGFSSGAQVDRDGNLNSVGIGTGSVPSIRLVGPILQPEHMALFGREIIMMPRHDRQCFVEHVDYVSGVGWPGGLHGRRALGLAAGGPVLIVTPLCVFDIDGNGDGVRVRSIHPGESESGLRRSTSFNLGDLSDIGSTPLPSAEELAILRNKVDLYGVLLSTNNLRCNTRTR
jgi:glutaconate CoA-transferase, subunit B